MDKAPATLTTLIGRKGIGDEETEYRPIQSEEPRRGRRWRPWLLRIPGLTISLLLTLVLIAVLEFLMRSVPPLEHSTLRSDVQRIESKLSKRAAQLTSASPSSNTAHVSQSAINSVAGIGTTPTSSPKSASSPSSPLFAGDRTSFVLVASTTKPAATSAPPPPSVFAGDRTTFVLEASTTKPAATSPPAAPPPSPLFAGDRTTLVLEASTTKPASITASPSSSAFAGEHTTVVQITDTQPQAPTSANFVGEHTSFSIPQSPNPAGAFAGDQTTFVLSSARSSSGVAFSGGDDNFVGEHTTFSSLLQTSLQAVSSSFVGDHTTIVVLHSSTGSLESTDVMSSPTSIGTNSSPDKPNVGNGIAQQTSVVPSRLSSNYVPQQSGFPAISGAASIGTLAQQLATATTQTSSTYMVVEGPDIISFVAKMTTFKTSAPQQSATSITQASMTAISAGEPAPISFAGKKTTFKTSGPQQSATSASQTKVITVTALFNSQNPYYNQNLSYSDCSDSTCVFDVYYPVWAFLVPVLVPVAVGVVFKTLWTCIHMCIRQSEPFSLLATTKGAQADESLLAYYLSQNLLPDFVFSLRKKHWLIFGSSIIFTVAGLLPSISSELLVTNTSSCPVEQHSSNTSNPCAPELNIDRSIARILQGLLAFTALMTIVVALTLWRRKETGLLSDPSAIFAVGSMVHHPDLVRIFQSIPACASSSELHHHLRGLWFKLGHYQATNGTSRYGFYPSPMAAGIEQLDHSCDETASGSSARKSKFRLVLKGISQDTLMGIFALGLIALVIAYYLDGSNSGFNRFFNSNGFGPRFILTGVASILAMQWTRLFLEVDNKNVYVRLAKGNAPASDTILACRYSTAVTGLVPRLLQKKLIVSSVAFLSVLAEALIVAAAGVPFGSGRLWEQYLVSTYVSIGILGLMIFGIGVVIYWRIRMLPFLPREPDTVASVISYVVANKCLFDEIEGLEFATATEGRVRLRNTWWMYGKSFDDGGEEEWKIVEWGQ